MASPAVPSGSQRRMMLVLGAVMASVLCLAGAVPAENEHQYLKSLSPTPPAHTSFDDFVDPINPGRFTGINCSISSSEFTALQDLYDATNGTAWVWTRDSASSHWSFPTTSSASLLTYYQSLPCSVPWEGISCRLRADGTSSTGTRFNATCTVTELDLLGHNLVGPLLDLSDLPSLEILNLAENILSGT
jgi:hypothetical protein